MNRVLYFTTLAAATFYAAICSSLVANEPQITPRVKVEAFDGSHVKLLPSPFLDAQQKNSEYLLSVDPDRLLSRIRENAGLKAKAKRYGGWEDQSIAGHSLGHYLSALSKTYNATGDERFKERALYIVKELDECQRASGTGMFAGDERYAEKFEQIRRGEIKAQGFDLNGLWVPWYTLHKIFAGLLDAYRYCDDDLALVVAKRFADWGVDVTKDLSFEQFQTMLRCEYGGTNDAYYTLYAFTGDEKYLRQGDRFYDLAVLKPLSEGRDELEGRHANTQIPKIIGLAHRHEFADDGEVAAFKLADFFWNRVVNHHSYAIGGNSSGEHFGHPDVISARFTDNTCETCNTYNMLKLTKSLYEQTGNSDYLSYFERALCNHILASIDSDPNAKDSLYTYYVPMLQGSFKRWSDRENTWTCCHGTGMENHAQYNGEIYYHGKVETNSGEVDVLYVNLLIPSTLTWEEKGLSVTIADNQLKVEAKNDVNLIVKARRPNNCSGDDEYWTAGESWQTGTVVKQIPFVPQWKIEATPDNPDVAAFFYGPFLYAGVVGPRDAQLVTALDEGGEGRAILPVVVTDNRDTNALVDVDNDGTFKLHAFPGDTKLVPFYAAKDRYNAYFSFFDSKTWDAKKTEFAKKRENQIKLAQYTVDFFQPGEMQPERDHRFQSEGSNHGTAFGKKWRDARGDGFMEFDMKVVPEKTNLLGILYWGGEVGDRRFEVLVDGVKVGEEKLDMNRPNHFFYQVYPIANPDRKDTIHVRFQSSAKATVGGFFGARTILEEGRDLLDEE